MLIYSITINIDQQVHEEWLHWMKTQHVPAVLATGLFAEYKMLRLLDEIDNGGVTYSFQYYIKTMDDFNQYQQLHADRLQLQHEQRYRNQFVTFQTLLEVME